MARPFYPLVNRHVTYYVTATRKPRSATITATAGGGSTTMSSASIVGATTISTVATAAVNQRITIMDATTNNIEQRRVTAVSGVGPFTLTVAALSYAHAINTNVRLEPTSVTLRVGHTAPIAGVTWRINKTDTNVWAPTA